MVQGSHFGFRTLPELSGEAVTASIGSAETDRDPLIERVLCDSSVLGEVCARLRDEPVVHVGRCSEGAVGLLLTALTENQSRPLLVLTSSPDAAQQLRQDITTFTGQPIGDFPMWESLFE